MTLQQAKTKIDPTIDFIRQKFGPSSIILGSDPEFSHLYLLRNKVNGKVYFGKAQKGGKARFVKHKSLANTGKGFYLHAAIRKYGADNFDLIHVGSASTRQEINRLERLCIELFHSDDREFGYNCTLGGDGMVPTMETRRKISEKATGRKLDEATKNKIRLAHLGKPERPEVKKSLSESRKGVPHPKHKESMKSVWERPEFRAHMAVAMREAWVRRKAKNVA